MSENIKATAKESAAPKPVNRSLRRKQAARIIAIQALYAQHFNPESANGTVDKWADNLLQKQREASEANDVETSLKEAPERAMLITLLESAQLHAIAIQTYIHDSMGDKWKPERMGALMAAIISVAIAELLAKPDKNPAIIISEYVTLTESYGDDAEVSFVNGILANIAKKIAG